MRKENQKEQPISEFTEYKLYTKKFFFLKKIIG